MKIEYAILGLLSWKPLTGYDIKKIMQESPFMYWSGNNNQIYKGLLELASKEWVCGEVIHQENAPSKKEYVITELGINELNEWVKNSELEPLEFKKTFLVQLSWSLNLEVAEIYGLLDKYEDEIRGQKSYFLEEKRREKNFPNRNEREQFIWEMLYENMVASYEAELKWLEQFRKGLEKWKV
jgi:DNA-binding PadR family transcriptional regulator